MVLSREYPAWFFTCVSLVALDVGSHWLQMYAQLLRNKSSHKDVDRSSFFILKLYYTNRIFMGACCVGAEVLYLAAHAATDPRIAAIAGPLRIGATRRRSPCRCPRRWAGGRSSASSARARWVSWRSSRFRSGR